MVGGFNPLKETINAKEAINVTRTGSRSLPGRVAAVCTGGWGRNSGSTEFADTRHNQPWLIDDAWLDDCTWLICDTGNNLIALEFAGHVEYAWNVR
jgi:hypothetical protein